MTFHQIENKVLKWANERKIIDFDNYTKVQERVLRTQTLKLAEEVGELNKSIFVKSIGLTNSLEDITDAIGDSLVVLTSITWALPGQLITTLDHIIKNDLSQFNTSKSQPALVVNWGLGELAQAVIKEKTNTEIRKAIAKVVYGLTLVCENYNIDLVDAYATAYHEIKDRVGKTTAEGNFIKEGD